MANHVELRDKNGAAIDADNPLSVGFVDGSGDGIDAANPLPVTDAGTFTPLGFQQITSVSASTALTVPGGATRAFIEAETQSVRWRPDGSTTAPTATVGHILPAGSAMWYAGDLAAIRLIEVAASAKLNVTYA
jgi:hypothetical protein